MNDISPSVNVYESNYTPNTNIYPTMNIGLYIGEFEKGDIDEPVLITDVLQFKQIFGRALDFNYNHWFQVYNYLSYPGNPKLWVCRTSGANTIPASNNGIEAKSGGEWGNLLTVEIYNKSMYNNSNYLKEIFGYYNSSEIIDNFLVVIKRNEMIVEYFNIGNILNLNSNYIKTINLVEGIYSLDGGKTAAATEENYIESFRLFSKENYEIDIVIAPEEFNNVVIDFVETRRDCVAFLGIPRKFTNFLLVNNKLLTTEENSLIVVSEYKLKNNLDELDYNNIKNYLMNLKKSSYCFMCFGFKSQLDRFTGKNRLINVNGDLAGLKASASTINPWSIGAGLEKGRVKNYQTIPLKIPKNKSNELYKIGVNTLENGIIMTQKLFVDESFNINKLNHRNIYNYLERKCEKILRKYLFDVNDIKLRSIIMTELKLLLEDMVLSRGIEAGKVIVSKDFNNNIIINIYMKIINISEFINVRFVNNLNSINMINQIQIKGY